MFYKEFYPLEKANGDISMVITLHDYSEIKFSYNCKPTFGRLMNDADSFLDGFSCAIKHIYVFSDKKMIFEFIDKGEANKWIKIK